MSHLCLSCYEILEEAKHLRYIPYKNKVGGYHICPKCGGEIVEIDDFILPTIILLNQRGYKTLHCCSGHPNENISNCYIKFDESIQLPSIPKGFRKQPNNTIRKMFQNPRQSEITQTAIDLLKWAVNLPKVKGDVEYVRMSQSKAI